jgi:hypothetical protein
MDLQVEQVVVAVELLGQLTGEIQILQVMLLTVEQAVT